MEAAARPFPNEDTTPPVTKMYFMIVLSLYAAPILPVALALVELLADFYFINYPINRQNQYHYHLKLKQLHFRLAFCKIRSILY